MLSLKHCCVKSILLDDDDYRKEQTVKKVMNIVTPFSYQWEYLILNLFRENDNDEITSFTIDNTSSWFEGSKISTPLECLAIRPSHIDLYILRSKTENTAFTKKWVFRYDLSKPARIILASGFKIGSKINCDNSFSTITHEIDHNATNYGNETIQCALESSSFVENFSLQILSSHVKKELAQLVLEDESRMWDEIKEFVSKLTRLRNREKGNVNIKIDVSEDPLLNDNEFIEQYGYEMQHVIARI